MSMSNLPNFTTVNQVQGGVSKHLGGLATDKNAAADTSATSVFGDFTHFLAKALSGGLSVASAASAVALPGVGLGISKVSQAVGGSLLSGLLGSAASATANQTSGAETAIAALGGQAGSRNLAQQAYLFAQSSSKPSRNIHSLA